MPEIDALSANIVKIRRKKCETQATFAFNCGISEEELGLLKRKKTDPKLSTLQNISAYVGITVSELLDVTSSDE